MPLSKNAKHLLLDRTLLRKSLSTHELHIFSQIDSTNQYLLDNNNKLSHGAVCLADEQLAGRGRRGRVWHSPLAGNIYLSQFFQYEGELVDIAGLSLVIGIAIAQSLTELNIANIQLKWPNDILWQEKKLGGILLETTPLAANKFGIVSGVGINFAMQESQATQIDQPWVSLAQIDQSVVDKTELVIILIQSIEKAVALFIRQGLQPFVAKWSAFDCYYDKEVKLSTEQGDVVGIAKGIDQQGALLLELNAELKAFHFGEVSLRKVKS